MFVIVYPVYSTVNTLGSDKKDLILSDIQCHWTLKESLDKKILWKRIIYSLTCILHLVHCWWIVLYRNVFANIIFGHIFVGIWKTVFTSHTLIGGQQVLTLHYWHPLFAQSRCIVSWGHYLNMNFGPLLELLSWQQAITVFTNNTMTLWIHEINRWFGL